MYKLIPVLYLLISFHIWICNIFQSSDHINLKKTLWNMNQFSSFALYGLAEWSISIKYVLIFVPLFDLRHLIWKFLNEPWTYVARFWDSLYCV